jgi:hypothetical protein
MSVGIYKNYHIGHDKEGIDQISTRWFASGTPYERTPRDINILLVSFRTNKDWANKPELLVCSPQKLSEINRRYSALGGKYN